MKLIQNNADIIYPAHTTEDERQEIRDTIVRLVADADLGEAFYGMSIDHHNIEIEVEDDE